MTCTYFPSSQFSFLFIHLFSISLRITVVEIFLHVCTSLHSHVMTLWDTSLTPEHTPVGSFTFAHIICDHNTKCIAAIDG